MPFCFLSSVRIYLELRMMDMQVELRGITTLAEQGLLIAIHKRRTIQKGLYLDSCNRDFNTDTAVLIRINN